MNSSIRKKPAKSQLDKFKEAAKELECDENEQAFKDKLRRITKPQKKKEPAD